MQIVMLSLDKKILDPNSAVAKRMVEYGEKDELFILIPNKEKQSIALSATARVETSGGSNKVIQLWKLFSVAKNYLRQTSANVITAQDPFFLGLIALLLRRRCKTSVEAQVHGDFFLSPYYRRGSMGRRLRYWLGKMVVRRADNVRAVGGRVKDSLLSVGVSDKKIEIRPVQVSADAIRAYQPKFDARKRFPEWKRIFLALGRLDPVKNIPWLLKVFAEARKERSGIGLLIVGDGPERGRLAELVKKLGLERSVSLAGWTDDPLSYIKTCDCLLFPSLSEGYGLVAMEAAAAGTKIIMNDVGVANYELKASANAEIIPVEDAHAWIKAILKI